MKPANRSPLITGRMALFLTGMAFAEASRTMTMVQIPVYLRELGADIQHIGLFFTISLIFPLMLRIFGGWLSDSIGRIRAVYLGSLAGLIGFAAYAAAPFWQLALLGPALLSITSALTLPSYKAYIADHTSPETRGRVFGISETTITLAWILGPPIGGMLAQNMGYRWMFAEALLAFGVATVIFWVMMQTRTKREARPATKANLDSLRSAFREMFVVMLSGGLVTWLILTDGVRDVAFKLSFDLMPVYLHEIAGITKQGIGFLDSLFGLALLASSFPGGWLVDKTSERTAVVLGLVTVVASRLVFAVAASFWGFAMSWILLGIGGGLLDPAYSSLVARGVPMRVRGITYGLLTTSLGVISLPSPWIGSQLWVLLGPKYPFLLTAAIGILAVFPAWLKLVVKEPVADAPLPAAGAPAAD